MNKQDNLYKCIVFSKTFVKRRMVHASLIREPIMERIHQEHSDWTTERYICKEDLEQYRAKYVHTILESEKGDLTAPEHEVLQSLQKHELVSLNIDSQFEKKMDSR